MKSVVYSDISWMERAIALAAREEGMTRPNPPVGAIAVNKGVAVGRGAHKKAGGPHAEVYALRQAADRARGATLFVTLEPCSTFGRTPPCTDAIVQSGISRVVVGAVDPNPLHAGRGLDLLRKAGIRVDVGVCEANASALIAPFSSRMLRGRPFLSLKLGLSLDGRIADRSHSSRWITGTDARALVQGMRCSSDAVMVGAGTVRHDNPSLWPRPDRRRNPWRIVVAGTTPLPISAQVFNDVHSDRTIVAAPRGWQPACANAVRRRGATVWELPKRGFLPALMSRLAGIDVMKVLCEGGGILAGHLLRAGLVDELFCIYAPLLLGGNVGAAGSTQWPLRLAPRFRLTDSRAVGQDLLARFVPECMEN